MNLIDTHFKKIAIYIRRSVDQIREIERLHEQIRLELDVIEYQLVQIKRGDYVRGLFEQVSSRGVVPETKANLHGERNEVFGHGRNDRD